MNKQQAVLVLVFGLLSTSFAGFSLADTIDAINGARAKGCDGRAGLRSPFVENPKLDTAARRMAQGASLHDALAGTGYLGIKSTSVRIGGSPGNATVGRVFRTRFCSYLLDKDFQEIGLYRRDSGLWFVLAKPFPLQAVQNSNEANGRILKLINEARSRPRRCGNDSFGPAPPLAMSVKLSDAALEHSRDMAKRNYFEHEGSDGSAPADRVTKRNYKWQTVGENIAAGIATPEEAVRGWIDSPHHCANLMNPRFTQTGIAYAIDPKSRLGIYWTQVFALPR